MGSMRPTVPPRPEELLELEPVLVGQIVVGQIAVEQIAEEQPVGLHIVAAEEVPEDRIAGQPRPSQPKTEE